MAFNLDLAKVSCPVVVKKFNFSTSKFFPRMINNILEIIRLSFAVKDREIKVFIKGSGRRDIKERMN